MIGMVREMKITNKVPQSYNIVVDHNFGIQRVTLVLSSDTEMTKTE